MALNFPNSPTIGQVYTDATSGFSYEWDGTVWKSYSAASSSQIKILDDISGSFNGIGKTFALTSNSVALSPPSSASLIINLGGVVQDPSDDYSVSGSNIIFSDAPTNGLSFSGVSLGPAIPINTIGIQSGSTTISNNVSTLRFIGAGNTFAVNGTTVDISIQGGGGGSGVSTTGILSCRGIANSALIFQSITLDDSFAQGTNYAMIGPITVTGSATTVTVGAGVSYVII